MKYSDVAAVRGPQIWASMFGVSHPLTRLRNVKIANSYAFVSVFLPSISRRHVMDEEKIVALVSFF